MYVGLFYDLITEILASRLFYFFNHFLFIYLFFREPPTFL